MAADNETVVEEPVTSGASPLTVTVATVAPDGTLARVSTPIDKSVSTELVSTAQVLLHRAGVAMNAVNTPPKTIVATPKLEVRSVDSYVNGVATPINVVQIGNELVGEYVAYDFLLMQAAAAKDGIALRISDGFRTYERQAKLYAERVNKNGSLTMAGVRLGRAAAPGYSNHQSGLAVDIHTGLTKAQRAAGLTSPTFLWLQANAPLYGFDNDEVPDEPWHWRHQEQRIVGPTSGDADYLLSLVSAAASGAAAVQSQKGDATLFLDKAVHDTSKSWERSAQMSRTTRGTIYANAGRAAVLQSHNLMSVASRYAQRVATEPVIPTYGDRTLSALTYDFTTGLWGDGRTT